MLALPARHIRVRLPVEQLSGRIHPAERTRSKPIEVKAGINGTKS
jgi:hypothetical protein